MVQTISNIDFNSMTTEELKALRSRITSVLNYRFGNELAAAKAQLYIGANCKVDHPKAYGKTFTVEKINPKNVICRENGNGRKWTITASMLEVIG
jgi:hypothetical protein